MRSFRSLLVLLLSASAWAQPTGIAYHGAGGPFVGAVGLFPGSTAPMLAVISGGYGYSYFLDGHLRVGGGGQGTLASPESGAGQTGSLGWGYAYVGWDPLADGAWEFPLAVQVGGGRLGVERALDGGLVDRSSRAFFGLQASASAELHLARTLKLAVMVAWMGGFDAAGLVFQGAEASLRLVFMLPLPGH